VEALMRGDKTADELVETADDFNVEEIGKVGDSKAWESLLKRLIASTQKKMGKWGTTNWQLKSAKSNRKNVNTNCNVILMYTL
jgi:hypothetical protein